MRRIDVIIKSAFKESNKHFKNHGFKYASSFFLTCFLKKYRYKTRLLAISKLQKEFGYVFENVSEKEYSVPRIGNEQKNIFVYRAQGINNIPPLVQYNLELIKKNYYDYKIILIDDLNFDDYVKIDNHLISLYKDKKITVQTFSDILRFNLLYQLGGIWVDSTILMFKRYEFFNEIKKNGFVSLNHSSKEKDSIWKRVYPVTYTTFFLGTHKGNPVMECCVKFYNEYYKKYDYAIDYFMNDYMLILCMKYKIGNDQLNRICYWQGSPFYLINNISNDKIILEKVLEIPQKMDWRSFDEQRFKSFVDESKLI